MEYYPFDSRNNLYRSKLGAIAAGETLRLRVLLHFDAHCHNVNLMLKNDCDADFSYIETIFNIFTNTTFNNTLIRATRMIN